jgi:hypothetical protein
VGLVRVENLLLPVIISGAAGVLAAAVVTYIQDKKHGKASKLSFDQLADREAEKVFNDEFREELRNKGRLHFEKVISENAMFLQQDLRLTTSQVNSYLKDEINKTLQKEFSRYESSISDAKQLAVESIRKTQDTLEEQRKLLGSQLRHEVAREKTRMIENFQANMVEIINHYLVEAIGNQIDLNDQLDYIISEIDARKDEIVKDIADGA